MLASSAMATIATTEVNHIGSIPSSQISLVHRPLVARPRQLLRRRTTSIVCRILRLPSQAGLQLHNHNNCCGGGTHWQSARPATNQLLHELRLRHRRRDEKGEPSSTSSSPHGQRVGLAASQLLHELQLCHCRHGGGVDPLLLAHRGG